MRLRGRIIDNWLMSDVELECLAKWKTNSELYVIGRLHGAGFTQADQRYRCLVSFDWTHRPTVLACSI